MSSPAVFHNSAGKPAKQTQDNDLQTLINLPDSLELQLQKKQMLKIMRFIGEDLKIFQPALQLPNSWILRCLINAVYYARGNQLFSQNSNWQTRIGEFLFELDQLTSSLDNIKRYCYQPDGETALFPNAEQFSPTDAAIFTKAAKSHLRDAHVFLV